MTCASCKPNEYFLWFKIWLACFYLFSFSFSCFYAFPAFGLTEGVNTQKVCSHVSNLIFGTPMRKVRIITRMLASYLDPILNLWKAYPSLVLNFQCSLLLIFVMIIFLIFCPLCLSLFLFLPLPSKDKIFPAFSLIGYLLFIFERLSLESRDR